MSVMKTITDYFRHHLLRAVLIVSAIVAVTLLSLIPAQVLRIIVDEIIPSGNTEKLLTVAIIFTITYLVIGLTTFIKDLIMLGTSQRITGDLRCRMMKHVEKMSYKSLVESDSGTMEAYFSNDINSINELFTSGVINMVTDLFKMIGIVVSIFVFSVTFGIIVLCVLPLLIWFTSFIRKRMLKAQLKTKGLEGSVNKVLLENVENIEQIKVNKAEKYSVDKYGNILSNHFKATKSSNFYDAFFPPMMQIIRYAVVCSVLLVSGYNPNFFGMTIGAIIAAISLLTDLFLPIESLGMEIQTIQKSVAAVKRIDGFFKMEENQNTVNEELTDYSILFENVDFSYSDKKVINDFSLKIIPGEKIALQGPSGAGKSTIMKLAMGLIAPTKGKVTIGGLESHLLDDEMRRNIYAIVYQDPFFSGGTIKDEITLKDDKITSEKVLSALKQVGLSYIEDIDKILNVREYSSGELALFNIARIIVRNPKVIFLDEMNAKIDPLTGKKIIQLIDSISRDKTVISINHYGSILKEAKIINIEPVP